MDLCREKMAASSGAEGKWTVTRRAGAGDGVFFSGRRGPRGGLSMVYSWTVNTAV